MSEVSKRDAQVKLINKYAAFSEKITSATTIAKLQVKKRELETNEIYVAAAVRFEAALQHLQKHTATQMSPPPPPKPLAPRYHVIARMLVNIEHTVADNIATMDVAADELHSQCRASILDAMQNLTDAESAQLVELQGDVRNSYLRTVALVQGVITRSAPCAQPAALPVAAQPAEVKIAAVQIGTFDGSSAKWESFREPFEQVFHLRHSMPAVQKLQHLKSCLRGEAEEMVANFSLTNDNPYELTRAHLRALNTLPSCKDSAADLRKLMNRTSSTLKALRNLRRPVEHWDDFIVVLVTDKLDAETRKMWEQANCTGTEFPKWTALETFIENRVRALNAIGSIIAVQSCIISIGPAEEGSRACNHRKQAACVPKVR